MALRIKCKCGKSLKIPSTLAGKKLACPACQKPFRIAADKFKKSASASAANEPKKKRTVPKPAEAPMPAPVELDIFPANLDWSGQIDHSQSDILSDLIPDVGAPTTAAADLSGAGCPACKQTLPQGAKLCVNCGFDLRTGRAIAGATVSPPVAQPVMPATVTGGYAGASSSVTSGARRKPKKGSSGGAGAMLMSPVAVSIAVLLTFLALFWAARSSEATATVYLLSSGVFGLTISIWLLVVAFSESVGKGFMCLCIPFYGIYFALECQDNAYLKGLYCLVILTAILRFFIPLPGNNPLFQGMP